MMSAMTNGSAHGADARARSQRIKAVFLLAAHLPFWLLVIWAVLALSEIDAASADGASTWMAGLVGFCLISFGITAAALRASARFLADPEEADDLRQQGSPLLLGSGALITAGTALILISLAGPERLLAPEVGLVGWLLFNALSILLVCLRWRLLDELNRTIAKEASHFAFGWLSVIAGSWAMLAQLGYASAPSPLDWLTMLSGFGFVGGLVMLAKRGGMEQL